MGMIYVLTLSNKPELLPQARESVRVQTRRGVHLVLEDTPLLNWGADVYPPAVFYNRMAAPCAADDYIIWLSDDDLLTPNALELLAGHLDTHPEHDAVYGLAEHRLYWPAEGVQRHYRTLPADGGNAVYSAACDPCGNIDGGQFMVRKIGLDKVGYPYTPEQADGSERTNDGILMRRVARACGIYPLQPQQVVTICRTTPYSAHSVPMGSGIAHANWKRIRA